MSETIDRLYLELSLVSNAVTKKELDLRSKVAKLERELSEEQREHQHTLREYNLLRKQKS